MQDSVLKIIERTLNYVDPRLIDHGKRVAYLVYVMLRRCGWADEYSLGRMLRLALLHDIGAYKTEEIDNMVRFETTQVWEHSVYGYQVIRHFSPLADLAPIILFHHADCHDLGHLHPHYRKAAHAIYVADRMDILSQTTRLSKDEFKAVFYAEQGVRFDSAVLDCFFRSGWETLFDNIDTDAEFKRILYSGADSREQMDAFIFMLALIIDFRSSQTVAHTLTSANACVCLAEYLALDPHERSCIFSSAMLHDLGKMGTPLSILEKPGALDADERKVMEGHVMASKHLLQGVLDDCALLMVARHHERLDGKGYPEGLTGKDLTPGQRLIAVGDVYSALSNTRSYKAAYPKERVIAIMNEQVAKGQIDAEITAALLQHYDEITRAVENAVRPVATMYDAMRVEYAQLCKWVRSLASFEGGEGGILPPPLPGMNAWEIKRPALRAYTA